MSTIAQGQQQAGQQQQSGQQQAQGRPQGERTAETGGQMTAQMGGGAVQFTDWAAI